MEVDSSINNTKLHFETLPEKTAKALLKISKEEFIKDSGWYLAGGTALTLCVGNRQSVDLDFFTIQKKFDELAVEREMENAGEWKKVYGENGTIYGVFEGAKVSFIAYPFFTPKESHARLIGKSVTRKIAAGKNPPSGVKPLALIKTGNCGILLNSPENANSVNREKTAADIVRTIASHLLSFSFC